MPYLDSIPIEPSPATLMARSAVLRSTPVAADISAAALVAASSWLVWIPIDDPNPIALRIASSVNRVLNCISSASRCRLLTVAGMSVPPARRIAEDISRRDSS